MEFRDTEGRAWPLPFNMAAIKRVKDVGINLLALNEGEPPLLMRLKTDAVLLWDVLYALVRPLAEQRGVSDEQFREAADGDVSRQAEEAFWAGLTDFFRRWGREPHVMMIQKTMELMAAANRDVIEKMTELTIEEALRQAVTPGSTSINSPVPLDSIPARSRSAS